jgi:hypothetical protein
MSDLQRVSLQSPDPIGIVVEQFHNCLERIDGILQDFGCGIEALSANGGTYESGRTWIR